MNADSVKLLFTYSIATFVIMGGGAMLYATRLDPPELSSDLALFVSGVVGAAIQFVFNRETQTSTARQVERATAAGVSSAVFTNPSTPTSPPGG
jgi:hypothetical protein